jgi:hypothetical protein
MSEQDPSKNMNEVAEVRPFNLSPIEDNENDVAEGNDEDDDEETEDDDEEDDDEEDEE